MEGDSDISDVNESGYKEENTVSRDAESGSDLDVIDSNNDSNPSAVKWRQHQKHILVLHS